MKNWLKILTLLVAGTVCAAEWAEDMYVAATLGKVAKLKQLLESNPELVNKDVSGMGTPLHLAAVSGKPEAVAFLLANKADANAKDPYGNTPLHKISRNNIHPDACKEIIELLLAHGADINAKGPGGETPLDSAVYMANMVAVETLLAHNADVNARDKYGERPLDHVKLAAHQHPKMLEVLLKHGAMKGAGALHRAVSMGDLAEVKRLLAEQPEVVNEKSLRGSEGNRPIQAAVIFQNKEILELLIASKADVNARDNLGRTALHWAIKGGKIEYVKLLLDNKAEVNAQDKDGRTPLDYAMNYRTETAALLRAHGGKSGKELDATDAKGAASGK